MRWIGAFTKCIELQVPNTFFKEYLTEHYTAVIEEQLSLIGEKRPVVFSVHRPEEPAPKEEKPTPEEPKAPLTKYERRKREYQQEVIYPANGVIVREATLRDLLKEKWKQEDEAEALASLNKQKNRCDSS